jgi:hypothetical protein
MRVLAIDPGPKESGVVLWDTFEGLLYSDVPPNIVVRDNIIKNDMRGQELRWDAMAIENIRGYGIVAGDDTFDTCIWIGRFDPWGSAMLIPRKEIKRHLCGNTTTNDKYVRQALIDRIGPQGTKKNPGPLYGISGHMWAALAVAITAADKLEGR